MRTTSQIVAALFRADADSPGPLADRLCRTCAEDLGFTGTALSVADTEGGPSVVGASGSLAEGLERLQFELGEGPAVDALRHSRPSSHPRLDHRSVERWPGFAPAALDAGIRAVFALPLTALTVGLGALALYRSEPGEVQVGAGSSPHAYAEAAVVLLLSFQAGVGVDGALPLEVEASVEHNAEVHQATGYVSARAAVGVTEALLLLRAYAYASDRPLLHVARDVLAGRLQIPREGMDE